MSPNFAFADLILLVPLAAIITYHDVRYRRIPNLFVLATLISGIILNLIFGGLRGVLASVEGCALAFGLMLMLHVLGAMGAGDVKLFASIGAVVGAQLVVPTFLIVALTGGVLALVLRPVEVLARGEHLDVLDDDLRDGVAVHALFGRVYDRQHVNHRARL